MNPWINIVFPGDHTRENMPWIAKFTQSKSESSEPLCEKVHCNQTSLLLLLTLHRYSRKWKTKKVVSNKQATKLIKQKKIIVKSSYLLIIYQTCSSSFTCGREKNVCHPVINLQVINPEQFDMSARSLHIDPWIWF